MKDVQHFNNTRRKQHHQALSFGSEGRNDDAAASMVDLVGGSLPDRPMIGRSRTEEESQSTGLPLNHGILPFSHELPDLRSFFCRRGNVDESQPGADCTFRFCFQQRQIT